MTLTVAYIGLGANLGDRAGNLARALNLLEQRHAVNVLEVSALYTTVPMYVTDQPQFLNAVARVETHFTDPEDLLAALLNVEYELGRRRLGAQRFGPRPIDLDLLLFDAVQHDSPTLTLPHPRMHERAFVLVPLCELAPGLTHPVSGDNFCELVQELPERDTVILESQVEDWRQSEVEVG